MALLKRQMAASPKSKFIDKRIAKSLITRLQHLACPYTEGVDESWITELVYKPGEQRIRLLQWLFCKIDSQLQDVIEPYHSAASLHIDSRIQKLLFVASSLGLCRYDDVDLIKGVVSTSRQTAFMDHLLEMACIIDEAEDSQSRAMSSPGVINKNTQLTEQFERDCYLTDSLAASERIDFSCRLSLLPADVKKTVERAWLDKGYSPSDWPPVPDLNQVILVAEDLAKNLTQQKDILQDLHEKFTFPDEDPQLRVNINKTTRLVLSELSQIVTGFSYCFENHMRQWCNKSAPRLTEMGPTFKRVHILLDQFSKLLSGLHTIHTSVTKLDSKVPASSQAKTRRDTNDLAMVGEETLKRLQECTAILEESFQRNETGSSGRR